jgi:cyanate permease
MEACSFYRRFHVSTLTVFFNNQELKLHLSIGFLPQLFQHTGISRAYLNFQPAGYWQVGPNLDCDIVIS